MAQKSGFQRKKVEVLTLGERLQKLRKERQVSMAELSKHTKIQMKYLRALEAGRYEELPSIVYVKGFLRSYEHFFGLPEESLVRLFAKEYKIYTNIHEKGSEREQEISRITKVPRIVVTPRMMIVGVVSIVLLGIAGYLYYGVDQFLSAPWLTITSPEGGTRTDAQNIRVEGMTHPEATVTLNGQNVGVDPEGHFVQDVALHSGENTITVRSKNSFDKEAERTFAVIATFAPAEERTPPVTEEHEGIHMVLKTGDQETWIVVRADDTELLNATVPAQSEHTFDAQKNILITAGHGDQVFVNVNGEDRGVLSNEPGVVRDVVFTAAAPGEPATEEHVTE